MDASDNQELAKATRELQHAGEELCPSEKHPITLGECLKALRNPTKSTQTQTSHFESIANFEDSLSNNTSTSQKNLDGKGQPLKVKLGEDADNILLIHFQEGRKKNPDSLEAENDDFKLIQLQESNQLEKQQNQKIQCFERRKIKEILKTHSFHSKQKQDSKESTQKKDQMMSQKKLLSYLYDDHKKLLQQNKQLKDKISDMQERHEEENIFEEDYDKYQNKKDLRSLKALLREYLNRKDNKFIEKILFPKLNLLEVELGITVQKIHQQYAKIILNMKADYAKKMKNMDEQFKIVVDKFISDKNQREKQHSQKFSTPKKNIVALNIDGRRSSCSVTSSPEVSKIKKSKLLHSKTNIDSLIQRDEEIRMEADEERNWELLCKLSDIQTKYLSLQEKYELLKKKNQELKKQIKEKQSEERICSSNNLQRNQKIGKQFESFMKKLINTATPGKKEINKSFFSEENFQELSKKIFEILQNFPMGESNIFFIPQNYEELNQAMNALLEMSKNYDLLNEERNVEERSRLKKLKNVLSDLIISQQISVVTFTETVKKSSASDDELISQCIKDILEDVENRKYSQRDNAVSLGSEVSFGNH